MQTIPHRELRNQISRVLRQVEAGERLRITVDGRAVADLVPVGSTNRTYVPRDEVVHLLARAPMDPSFAPDINRATGATVGE